MRPSVPYKVCSPRPHQTCLHSQTVFQFGIFVFGELLGVKGFFVAVRVEFAGIVLEPEGS